MGNVVADLHQAGRRKRLFALPKRAYEPIHNRILMVTSTVARGGCERQILSAAIGLLERNYQVAIIAFARPAPGESLEAEINERSIPLSYSHEHTLVAASGSLVELPPSLPVAALKYAAGLQSAILEYRPYIVHAWSDFAAIVGGSTAAALDVPRIILGQRNVPPPDYLPESEIYRQGYQILAANAGVRLTNNSAKNARDYERWLGLVDGSIAVIRNGYLPSTVSTPSPDAVQETRRALGILDNAKVVGSLMRFVEQKDPDLWLATAEQIAREREDVHFVLGGYGELRDKIVNRVRGMGISHRFALLDAVTDLGSFYGLIDVFLMTSQFEGTPNVLIEAQTAGCAVVTTDVGGIRETVADGATARVVANRAPETLAAAVIGVLDDDRWRSDACEAGPSFVQQRFGHARMTAQMLRLYYPPTFLGAWLAKVREHCRASNVTAPDDVRIKRSETG